MRRSLATFFVASTLCAPVWAGGGGENMILVVNPNDENSLRIANAYAQLRHIPDSNIIFDITPVSRGGYMATSLSKQQVNDLYITPLANIIQQRGLTNIDYISVLGQATAYTAPPVYGSDTRNSITYALSLLTPLSNGLDTDAAPYHASPSTSSPVRPRTIPPSITARLIMSPSTTASPKHPQASRRNITWPAPRRSPALAAIRPTR